jgi:hypothetical protein
MADPTGEKRMKMIRPLVLAALMAASPLAFADADKPLHGGLMQEVREISYELVAKPDTIALYITDHGKKVPSAGATAKLTLLNGTEKSEVAMAPAGDNKLEAKGAFKVQKGTRVVALVTLAGKPAVTARYEIK